MALDAKAIRLIRIKAMRSLRTDKGQGYGPSWKGQTLDCPKSKEASGISFKKWSIDLRRWTRVTWFSPDIRMLKILESLPENLRGIFQNVPDGFLFGLDGMDMGMKQVQIHCGLRPEDEMKDVMNASMDTKRKVNESITTWLCRVQQAWMIAEINQICTNPDATKI